MATADIDKLRKLVTRLRAPDGCPWDREQTLADVRAYLLEEAHEAAAAIDTDDRGELSEELGDLIFQAVFVAVLAEEEGAFDLASAIDAVHAKMIERHPHVFGDEKLADADAVRRAWERRKLEKNYSVLQGIPASLPALTGAFRTTQKVAAVGFDWSAVEGVLDKVREELAEVAETVGGQRPRRDEEIGDLLFAVVNLARHLEVDPEGALSRATRKFQRRFQAVEATFEGDGDSLAEATAEEMDRVWEEVKSLERAR
ncbi:MAG: nucleoside triphosphate pyrophosphohydrolase [bacterium]|nr:nucleoside triphosphate pyrophosphohydrolase [bacterium]